LRRGRINIDDALLSLLHAIELTADLVRPDELYPDGPVGPLLEVVHELKATRPLDQKIALVEAGRAELQLEFRLRLEPLLVSGIRRLGQSSERNSSG